MLSTGSNVGAAKKKKTLHQLNTQDNEKLFQWNLNSFCKMWCVVNTVMGVLVVMAFEIRSNKQYSTESKR